MVASKRLNHFPSNIAFWHTSYTCHVGLLWYRSYLLQAPNLHQIPQPTNGAPPTGATHQLSKSFRQSHVDMTLTAQRKKGLQSWSCWLFTLFNPQLFRCLCCKIFLKTLPEKVPVVSIVLGAERLRGNFPLSLVSILWWWILRIGWCPQR